MDKGDIEYSDKWTWYDSGIMIKRNPKHGRAKKANNFLINNKYKYTNYRNYCIANRSWLPEKNDNVELLIFLCTKAENT